MAKYFVHVSLIRYELSIDFTSTDNRNMLSFTKSTEFGKKEHGSGWESDKKWQNGGRFTYWHENSYLWQTCFHYLSECCRRKQMSFHTKQFSLISWPISMLKRCSYFWMLIEMTIDSKFHSGKGLISELIFPKTATRSQRNVWVFYSESGYNPTMLLLLRSC